MKVNREDLLRALERLQPGLSVKGGAEQADAFCFRGGLGVATDRKTWCRGPVPGLEEVEGAVSAKPLLAALRKMPDEEVAVRVKDSHLKVRGQGREVAVRLHAEVALPFDLSLDSVKWDVLDEAFSDAVEMVRDCAGGDSERQWIMTTVNVTPRFVEACDGVQACRYRVPVPVLSACVVEKAGLTHVVSAGMTEAGSDDSWLHFRSPDGFHMSFRRHAENYPDLKAHYRAEGEGLTLPKSLPEAIDLAEQFSREDRDNNRLLIELRGDRVRVTGTGATGYASVWQACRYAGPGVSFYMPPAVLKGVIDRGAECLIGGGKLMINGGGVWRFCCALGAPDPKRGDDGDGSGTRGGC